MRFVSPKSSGSFWKGGCYEIFFIFYKVLDPFPVSCLSLTRFNRFRSHIFKLAKVKIRLFGPPVSDRHWVQTLNRKKSHAGHASCLAWQARYDLKDPAGLAGFLIDSDIKLVRAESGSPDEWSRHKSQGHMKRHGMHKSQGHMKRHSLFWLGVLFGFLV